jgi:hypothetical protein
MISFEMTAKPAIVVHSLTQAVAVLQAAAETGRPVLLLSAVDAGLSVGAGGWREMVAAARDSVPEAGADALLDCGDDAGAAQAALREGVEAIVFSGRIDVFERLADIARGRGARVLSARPPAALDLAGDFFASSDTLRRRVLAVLMHESPEIFVPGAAGSQDDGSS